MNLVSRITVFAAAFLVLSVGVAATAAAEDATPLTDSQLIRIRSQCSTIQTSLSRTHANDALTRVNRGRVYERLSTKLMAPLNSRAALNRLDATMLVQRTTTYEAHLAGFRTDYQAYEQSLSALMKINCETQPARFYDALQTVRTNREAVRLDTRLLAEDAVEYKKAFLEFAAPYREKDE
jgi:hypothetical protein